MSHGSHHLIISPRLQQHPPNSSPCFHPCLLLSPPSLQKNPIKWKSYQAPALTPCFTQSKTQRFYNNYWCSITFRSCESPYRTPVTHGITHQVYFRRKKARGKPESLNGLQISLDVASLSLTSLTPSPVICPLTHSAQRMGCLLLLQQDRAAPTWGLCTGCSLYLECFALDSSMGNLCHLQICLNVTFAVWPTWLPDPSALLSSMTLPCNF